MQRAVDQARRTDTRHRSRAARPAGEWLQVNVSLARRGGSALQSARALLRTLEAALPRWQRDRIVRCFFFQRKPPDLRLRFQCVGEGVLPRLRPVMSRMKAEGHVLRSFCSVYEPEQRQFGGRECMQHIHTHWAADSMTWLALDRAIEAGEFRIPCPTLMAAILNELFWRTLGDGGEVWDTWCNVLDLLHGEAAIGMPRSDPITLDALTVDACEAELGILVRCRDANARLAAALLRAWERGRMTSGMRSILPYIALFTLNRHGFDQANAAAIARSMAAAWDPKARMRGSLQDPPTWARRIARAIDAG